MGIVEVLKRYEVIMRQLKFSNLPTIGVSIRATGALRAYSVVGRFERFVVK
jgi:hypothetical protein